MNKNLKYLLLTLLCTGCFDDGDDDITGDGENRNNFIHTHYNTAPPWEYQHTEYGHSYQYRITEEDFIDATSLVDGKLKSVSDAYYINADILNSFSDSTIITAFNNTITHLHHQSNNSDNFSASLLDRILANRSDIIPVDSIKDAWNMICTVDNADRSASLLIEDIFTYKSNAISDDMVRDSWNKFVKLDNNNETMTLKGISFIEAILAHRSNLISDEMALALWNKAINFNERKNSTERLLTLILENKPNAISRDAIRAQWEKLTNNSVEGKIIHNQELAAKMIETLQNNIYAIDTDTVATLWEATLWEGGQTDYRTVQQAIIRSREDVVTPEFIRNVLNSAVELSESSNMENAKLIELFLKTIPDRIDPNFIMNIWNNLNDNHFRRNRGLLNALLEFQHNGKKVLSISYLQNYVTEQSEHHHKKELISSVMNTILIRTNRQTSNNSGDSESITKIDYQNAYAKILELYAAEITKLKQSVYNPREAVIQLIRTLKISGNPNELTETDKDFNFNIECAVEQLNRKNKVTNEHLYSLLAVLKQKEREGSKDVIKTFVTAFIESSKSNIDKGSIDSCLPQAFIIDALGTMEDLNFLQFYCDEAFESSMFNLINKSPANDKEAKQQNIIRKQINEKRITQRIFFEKHAILNLLKQDRDNFRNNLKQMARQEGLRYIPEGEDQDIRLKIIEKYYRSLEKNEELLRIQEDKERRFEKLKRNAKYKDSTEIFEYIKAYMAEDTSGLYDSKNDYTQEFKKIYKDINNIRRELDKRESDSIETFISTYKKATEGKLLTNEELKNGNVNYILENYRKKDFDILTEIAILEGLDYPEKDTKQYLEKVIAENIRIPIDLNADSQYGAYQNFIKTAEICYEQINNEDKLVANFSKEFDTIKRLKSIAYCLNINKRLAELEEIIAMAKIDKYGQLYRDEPDLKRFIRIAKRCEEELEKAKK